VYVHKQQRLYFTTLTIKMFHKHTCFKIFFLNCDQDVSLCIEGKLSHSLASGVRLNLWPWSSSKNNLHLSHTHTVLSVSFIRVCVRVIAADPGEPKRGTGG